MGATTCPFCGSPVVMPSKFSGALRPDIVIPFKLDKNAALRSLQQHYLGKKLLPKVFQDKNHLDEVKGVYVPFWLYDAENDVQMEYHGNRTRSWSDSKYNYTETSVYRALRAGSVGFDRVPVDGSRAMDDALMESIEPFHMEEAVDFRTAYLAGYFANKYDVDAESGVDRAHERICNSVRALFAGTVTGYDAVTEKSASIRHKNGRVRYALLPVWVLGTSWKGKSFQFAMNGQTGKFVGDLPLDKAAFRKRFVQIFSVSAAVFLAISLFAVSLL
jgi:hypothetical protein